MSGNGAYRWNSAPGSHNPPASPYDLPVPLVTSAGKDDQGIVIFDCNGDGLPDIQRYLEPYNTLRQTWINQGGRGASAWILESTPASTAGEKDSYALPVPLHNQTNGIPVPYGFEQADLNGDGLPDFLYSNESQSFTAGPDNLAILNTGNGWLQREAWRTPGGFLFCGNDANRERGERGGKLMDVNSDGFPDFISDIAGGPPRVWFNQCRPEVLVAVTDAFGSQLRVEYKRLNDPSVASPATGVRVYEKGNIALPAGQIAQIDSRLVVSRYSEPDGSGSRRYKSQRYGDLRYDRFNESSLGFGWVEQWDELNGQRARTETMRLYPFGGSPKCVSTYVYVSEDDLATGTLYPTLTAGLKLVTQETAEYSELPPITGIAGGTVHRPIQTKSEKSTFDLSGSEVTAAALKIRTTTTQNLADFDDYGFVKKSSVTSLDGTSVVTNSIFNHDIIRWHLGRLSQSIVVKSLGGDSSTKTAAFTYVPATGLLLSETVEPADPHAITKTYGYDDFGNITMTSVAADGIARYSTNQYDSRGRFTIGQANQLGHTTSLAYDQDKALLISSTDIAGRTARFFYDSFGTQIQTNSPDGTQIAEITGFATNSSLPAAVASDLSSQIKYFRAKETSGSPVVKVYFDSIGRELVSETTILRNANASGTGRYSKVYVISKYDAMGRKWAVSRPFAAGETPVYTKIVYDFLDRAISTSHPDNTSETAGGYYQQTLNTLGLAVQPATYSWAVNASGQPLERWEDQHGKLIQSRDASLQLTTFHYDLDGRLVKVALNAQELLTNTYDKFGNKTSVWEANSGISTSVYNGFGEVVSTTNAKGQTTTFTYDVLGRQISVTRPPDTSSDTSKTFNFYYDQARGSGLGKPWKTTGPSGYQEEISYDSLGRACATRKTQFGETFTTSATYDALGRPLTSTDAGGLVLVNGYDPLYSFPVSVTLAGGAPGTNIPGAGTVLWRAGTFDSSGRATAQTFAQGVETDTTFNPGNDLVSTILTRKSGAVVQEKSYGWDGLGNLIQRVDSISKRTEVFSYDELNRVANSTIYAWGGPTSTVPPPESYTYDSRGNLLTKGDATLIYTDSRPNAVRSAEIKGQIRIYSYDAAGYVVNDSKRSYTWTSFGQLLNLSYPSAPQLKSVDGVLQLDQGDVFTAFDFDASGTRARQTKTRSLADSTFKKETTTYLGSYERETHETNIGTGGAITTKTIHRHSVGGLIFTQTVTDAGSVSKLTNILKDHLGSTDLLLTGVWNGSVFAGSASERQAFDAWGERRNAGDWTKGRTTDAQPFLASAQDYDRGYTGHEQLDDSGLIHMNGRIYDPELGRMLSPDPLVQVPEYSQNFNRYSYVMNNPLNMTDPTGFSWLSNAFHKMGHWISQNWKTIVVIVVVAVVSYFCPPLGYAFGNWAGGVAVAAGASIGTAVTVASAACYAAIGAIAGFVGGALGAALNGGDLGDVLRAGMISGVQGAITGGLLHGMEPGSTNFSWEMAEHVAGHGIVGGAANAAMGGKFQDGLLSAAASAFAGDKGWLDGATVATRTIKSGIVGGTVSVIGGGKFANGAYTSAFQHLLNAEIPGAIENALENKSTPWLKVAAGELGTTTKGASGYWTAMGQKGSVGSWCSAFTCWALEKMGIASPHAVTARAFDQWRGGIQSNEPSLGAVATIHWPAGEGDNGLAWKGHSTFVVATFDEGGVKWIVGLGGNQDHIVKYKAYPISSSSYQRPITFARPAGYQMVEAPILQNWSGDRLSIGTER